MLRKTSFNVKLCSGTSRRTGRYRSSLGCGGPAAARSGSPPPPSRAWTSPSAELGTRLSASAEFETSTAMLCCCLLTNCKLEVHSLLWFCGDSSVITSFYKDLFLRFEGWDIGCENSTNQEASWLDQPEGSMCKLAVQYILTRLVFSDGSFFRLYSCWSQLCPSNWNQKSKSKITQFFYFLF